MARQTCLLRNRGNRYRPVLGQNIPEGTERSIRGTTQMEHRSQSAGRHSHAYPEVFNSLYKVGADTLTGVFHSFTGNEAELEEIKKLKNFKIGINGVITFKNSKLSEIIRQTDIRKIVLETDAPYLAPVPYRGRRNEPAYIWKTAEKVALTYGLTLEETVETTRINALKLFKIENKPIS